MMAAAFSEKLQGKINQAHRIVELTRKCTSLLQKNWSRHSMFIHITAPLKNKVISLDTHIWFGNNHNTFVNKLSLLENLRIGLLLNFEWQFCGLYCGSSTVEDRFTLDMITHHHLYSYTEYNDTRIQNKKQNITWHNIKKKDLPSWYYHQ